MSSSDLLASLLDIKSYGDAMNILRPKLYKLHIPLDDILYATNNFSVDNRIKRGIIADLYKGKLRSKEQMDVFIRKFTIYSGILYADFMKEVATLSCVNHTNILSFVGYSDDDGKMIMVFKYENKGSLDEYLSNPNLTWSQRSRICVGVAHALRYIHKDIKSHLRHGYHPTIKSSKILLDEHWEAKLFCFGFQINCSESSFTVLDAQWIHMSDVYSFGEILFEVLCKRKTLMIVDDESLVSMATRLYEEGKLEDMINPKLRKQIPPQSLSLFSQIAYDCVNQFPSMDLIVERLQEAADLLSKYKRLEKDYAQLKFPLNLIMLATENFASKYLISSNRDDMVYQADKHFDINSILIFTTERKNNRSEFPKMYDPVTIKRNINRNYAQVAKEFIADIEMLATRKHPNIVSLVGFAWEGFEIILIFEPCAHYGSLADHLGSIREKTNLTWTQRIRICLDIAKGLEYLHNNMEADRPKKNTSTHAEYKCSVG